MVLEWFWGQMMGKAPERTKSLLKRHSMMDGSTSASTPTGMSLVDETTSLTTSFLQLCCQASLASDDAVSLVEEISFYQDERASHRGRSRSTARRRTTSRTGSRSISRKRANSRSAARRKTAASPPSPTTTTKPRFVPPRSINVYRPKQEWPDGTLQILWKPTERDVHGLVGVDKHQAHIELAHDDLSTIEISDEISSKFSGMSIELHPDENTTRIIGNITCYVVRPEALDPDQLDIPQGCPAQLKQVLSQCPKLGSETPWREEGCYNESPDDEYHQEVYWKHHWHPTTKVSSYLWIEDVNIDKDYRGIGLGFSLIEDACRRVGNRLSWILVSPPKPRGSYALVDYFQFMGFQSLPDTPFLARWNASPLNPRLEEVLPSAPFTTQQSKDQGFQL